MTRILKVLVITGLMLGLTATAAMAGSPHFVGTPTRTESGNTLSVSGKVAGLGNEDQINVAVTALAACVNRGGNFPEADNKESFNASGTFPVKNGKANFSAKARLAAGESTEMPRTLTPLVSYSRIRSRNPQPCLVQPGVSALG